MRIAVCYQAVDPRLGGAETYVIDLCRGLIRAGHAVDLVAERWVEDALPAGLGRARIAVRGLTRLGRIWDFARQCDEYLAAVTPAYDATIGFLNTWGQDVLIPQGGVRAASLEANAERFPTAARRAAYRVAKRLNARWWLYQAIERRQYDPARGSRFVAVSRMVRGHMARHHGVTDQRVSVIPNAIDESRLAIEDPSGVRRSFRARLGCGEGPAVGLFVAHNFRLKGLEPLLHAMAHPRIAELDGMVRLAVCGGGDAAPFRRLAQRLGVSDHVHFLGFLPDVRAGYHGADFLVLPSYYDPCSLVVFEALACGLPVITTRRNGAGELITEGVEGYVIERPDDVAPLAAALAAMADASARRRMSEAARSLGRQQTFEAHLERVIALLEDVASRKGQGTTRRSHARATRGVRAGR